LTLSGGFLRFSATSFGLPDLFRPDEEFIVPRALGFERDGNPHMAYYPAGHIYLLHAALRLFALFAGRPITDFRDSHSANKRAPAYLISRRISAAMGTATLPAVYFRRH